MPDQSQSTLTHTRLAVRRGARAVASGARLLGARLRLGQARLRLEQTGQDVLEYAGMIVLVAAVIVLIFSLNVPTTVETAVRNAVNAIVSNGSSSYVPPAPIQAPKGSASGNGKGGG